MKIQQRRSGNLLQRTRACIAILLAIAMVGQPAALTHASPYIWTGAENSNWDFTSGNWSDGVDPVLWQNGNTAVFNGSAPGTIGVSLITVAGIEVSSSGYSFTGGTIDFGESGAPFQIDNDVTIDSILNGDTLVKTGNGSLTLSTNFALYFGGITVSAGAVVGTTASLRGDITNNALVTFDQGLDGEYSGSMSGSGSLTKIGSGAVTLSAINGYTGATAVNGGQLLVNGELGNTAVSVTSGGLLGGSGRILGDVTVDSSGTMSPGSSPGILTVGSLSLSAGSHTVMEITGTSSSLYDQIVGTGAGPLSYGGSLDLVMSGSYADQTTFHLFSNFSSSNEDFSSLTMAGGSGPYAGLTFGAIGTGGYGADAWVSDWTTPSAPNGQRLVFYQNTGVLAVVPEPSTYAMALAGLACGGWQIVRRRRLRQAPNLTA